MLSFDMCDRIGSLRRYLEEKNFENLDNIVILPGVREVELCQVLGNVPGTRTVIDSPRKMWRPIWMIWRHATPLKNTVANYRRSLSMFSEWLPEDRLVNEARVNDYQKNLLAKYTPRTVNMKLTAVNGLLRYLGASSVSVYCQY